MKQNLRDSHPPTMAEHGVMATEIVAMPVIESI
jgi:hypothetical protein